MKVHAETRPLQKPFPKGKQGASVVVEPLLGGELQGPPGFFERPGGSWEKLRIIATPRSRWRWLPVQAFLIRHPSAGPILVDTGLHPSVADRPRENLGGAWAWIGRPQLEPGRDVPAQLRERGVNPKRLPIVVMTHLHEDHASGMSEFGNSIFVISEPEWVTATTEPRPALQGYRQAHYDYAFDYRLISYEGEGIESYSTFGRTFDLFGDGTVRLAFTPGHTAGHQSVICHLRDRDLVIAGDAIYTMRQLEGGAEPLRPYDRRLWRRSLQELQLFRRQYKQTVIVPGHDRAAWNQLDKRYE